jgi:hypothetical protein
MRVSISYATSFRLNLSQYRSKLTEEKNLNYGSLDTQVVEQPDLVKFKHSDLYLDYGPEPPAPVETVNFIKTHRQLNRRPDLSEDIVAARQDLKKYNEKNIEILEKEQNALNNLVKVQQNLKDIIDSQDLRQKNSNICQNERLELIKCLKFNTDCTSVLNIWKQCQESTNRVE